ncbi:vWA domain-containing protein [Natronoflexus pectinivorans]|uniref:Ca-activated chloride channel family protein n=1 Tax=Natronoflexus pectinivorans TaxID=682526 RepID=A0A4R2GLA0_9BACT|nr:VWA domain-containing protein [Natronoflexus pectinivorans]TCO09366.1 Ca-activated chloride channel family protein [Natronoflexus pectinivorans]
MNYTFLHPNYFYLLLLLIPMIAWYIWKQKTAYASLQISTLRGFASLKKSKKTYLRHLPFALRCLTLIFLIIALARPQSTNRLQNVTTEGIDIMISLDISGSMLAMDFEPNRMEAAKEVAIDFIRMRPHDRIGLTIFAGEAFTLSPLTLDHSVLINLMRDVRTGMVEDGTAIGMGLAAAANRLKDSDAKSKVIILLSDGENNRGQIAPLTAAEIARTFGIRVYTVGVGSIGTAPFPVNTVFGTQIQNVEVRIDEDMLTEIAGLTGGKYFRATDRSGLDAIYREIDELERHQIEVQEYTRHSEEFLPFALLAMLFLLTEILLRNTVFRTLP